MAPALHFRTTLGLGSLFQHRRVLQHADDAGHVLMAAGRRRCVGGERRLKPGASSDGLSASARQDCRAWSTRRFACTPDHRRTAGCILHLLLGYRTPLLKEESSNQVLKLIKACRIVPHHHINSSRFAALHLFRQPQRKSYLMFGRAKRPIGVAVAIPAQPMSCYHTSPVVL